MESTTVAWLVGGLLAASLGLWAWTIWPALAVAVVVVFFFGMYILSHGKTNKTNDKQVNEKLPPIIAKQAKRSLAWEDPAKKHRH